MEGTRIPSAAQTTSDEFILNIGPQHPATHGVLRVVVTMDGEVVKELVPHIGYVHRGLEKLFENRLYEQIIPFTDRTDYLSAIANNFAYVMAVERLLGLQVPAKVEYTRVMAAELNRIASHLLWLAAYGLDMGAFTPFLYAFRDREEIGSMIEEASGRTAHHQLLPHRRLRLRAAEGSFRQASEVPFSLRAQDRRVRYAAHRERHLRGPHARGRCDRPGARHLLRDERSLSAGVERRVGRSAGHSVFSVSEAVLRHPDREEWGHVGPFEGEDRGDAPVRRGSFARSWTGSPRAR